jgi:tetratricopeptide (TPR) repeat protein
VGALSQQRADAVVLAACAAAALGLGAALSRLEAGRLPQAGGENVIALVLGDARQHLSEALYDKVEEYFHGGVQGVACEHGLAHGGSEEACEEHGHHEHGEHESTPAQAAGGFDPWRRLNARLHVQEHRHMENDQAADLLPWVWASCRASPKNAQAFVSGSYILARMLNRPEEGAELLRQGIAHNPECAELDFSLGELYMGRLRDPASAEPYFRSALAKCKPAEGEAGAEARELKVRTLFYLGFMAKSRGDLDGLRACVREAEAADPEYVSTKDLRALLRAAEGENK